MNKLLRLLLASVGILAFSSLGMPTHAATTPTHGSHDSAHRSASSACASLCFALPASRESEEHTSFPDNDDTPKPKQTFLSTLTVASDKIGHDHKARRAMRIEPPPGPPIHLVSMVFRF